MISHGAPALGALRQAAGDPAGYLTSVPTRLLVGFVIVVFTACGGEDLGGEKLAQDAVELGALSAAAMGNVESVAFSLERNGAQSISLDGIDGRFSAPGSADAIMEVTVNGSLGTKLGAVAIDDEIWMSNPVTGKFETLPPGFDIDPSAFFDPKRGWQPLLDNLTDLVFVAEEDRDGTRYHLTGTAPAQQMQIITAGLVRGEDIELDMWLHPVTALVTAIEFETVFDDQTSKWVLELDDYGATFEITDPTL